MFSSLGWDTDQLGDKKPGLSHRKTSLVAEKHLLQAILPCLRSIKDPVSGLLPEWILAINPYRRFTLHGALVLTDTAADARVLQHVGALHCDWFALVAGHGYLLQSHRLQVHPMEIRKGLVHRIKDGGSLFGTCYFRRGRIPEDSSLGPLHDIESRTDDRIVLAEQTRLRIRDFEEEMTSDEEAAEDGQEERDVAEQSAMAATAAMTLAELDNTS